MPVSGLAATDFTIDARSVGAGGSQVEITSAGGGRHGDYLVDVDQGQPVCAVFVH